MQLNLFFLFEIIGWIFFAQKMRKGGVYRRVFFYIYITAVIAGYVAAAAGGGSGSGGVKDHILKISFLSC